MNQYLIDFGTIYIQAGILIVVSGIGVKIAHSIDAGIPFAKCGAVIFCIGIILYFIGKNSKGHKESPWR